MCACVSACVRFVPLLCPPATMSSERPNPAAGRNDHSASLAYDALGISKLSIRFQCCAQKNNLLRVFNAFK